MDYSYIYTTTDAREVQEIVNNGRRFLAFNLTIPDGRTVQNNLGLDFNPSSYIQYDERMFTRREINGIVRKLTRERQFVAVSNGDGTKQYIPRCE
ncbi:MAG TPA: hypothetical protein VMC07_02975 [Candidatus Omnitrophota bacterium]|nr:hypothetical protein [Candidatus Omnitrophota bacterium]